MQDIKLHKASGPDSIPTFILNIACWRTLSCPIEDISDLPRYWRSPNRLEKALIVPIYKKGDKDKAPNYRPVSLISVICKILEHVVYSNVMNHLLQNNILSDNQHGFRAKRSCETQLITTLQGITSHLHSGRDQVNLILLDFSKAFHRVPHQRLLHKLEYYAMRGDTLRWIQSFLGYRKQQVLLEGVTPAEADVILGPRHIPVSAFISCIHQRVDIILQMTRSSTDM